MMDAKLSQKRLENNGRHLDNSKNSQSKFPEVSVSMTALYHGSGLTWIPWKPKERGSDSKLKLIRGGMVYFPRKK